MPLLSEYETVAWKKCYASRTSLPPLPQNHHPTAPLKFLCQVRIGGASFSKTSEPSSSFVVLQGGFTKMVLKFVVRLCRTLSTWATTSSRSTLTPTRTDVVLSRARRPRPTMKQAEDAEDAATSASAPAAVLAEEIALATSCAAAAGATSATSAADRMVAAEAV